MIAMFSLAFWGEAKSAVPIGPDTVGNDLGPAPTPASLTIIAGSVSRRFNVNRSNLYAR